MGDLAGSVSTIAMLKEDQGPTLLEELGLSHLYVDSKVGGHWRNELFLLGSGNT